MQSAGGRRNEKGPSLTCLLYQGCQCAGRRANAIWGQEHRSAAVKIQASPPPLAPRPLTHPPPTCAHIVRSCAGSPPRLAHKGEGAATSGEPFPVCSAWGDIQASREVPHIPYIPHIPSLTPYQQCATVVPALALAAASVGHACLGSIRPLCCCQAALHAGHRGGGSSSTGRHCQLPGHTGIHCAHQASKTRRQVQAAQGVPSPAL